MWNEEFTAVDDNQEISENIRKQIIIPLIKLKRNLKKDVSAEEISRMLYEYLVESTAERNLGILMNRLIKSDRDSDAAELKRLWSCLMDILDSIASTLGENKIPFSDIASIMRSMIGRITYSVPPQMLDSVTVASARTARLSTPKIIFVVGASEGDFPNQVNLHGIFSDGDKQKLSIQGIDISRPVTDLIASERLIVYKSLTSASEKLYLTYPLSDLSGQAKYPAQIIEQITSMFSTEILITEDSISPDFYAVTMPAAYYHYMRDRAECSVGISSIYETIMSDDEYSRRIVSAVSKKDEVHNYHISTGIMEKLRSFNPLYLSPTAVENFNRCHFMYFCNSFLRLYVPEKIDLDMRIAGELTHSCFFSILASRSKKEFEQLPYDKLREEIQSSARKYRKEKMAGDFGKTPRFELFFNKLTERLENVFLHMQYSL
ncbi:MAG: exodeoxyribonuclease V subunit gamma, partial [Ruminococcus sp.]|nr:exodeoxyribonuclease V subunit gamma [Ruminococcus sp.]